MNIEAIADRATEAIYDHEPALLKRFGEQGKQKCREDNHHHLKHLQTAYELNDLAFFTDYAIWLNGILIRHGMETKHLIENFEILHALLEEEENDAEVAASYRLYLTRAIEVLQGKL